MQQKYNRWGGYKIGQIYIYLPEGARELRMRNNARYKEINKKRKIFFGTRKRKITSI